MARVIRIGVRELRQQASRYLSEVKAGHTVEVTERGRLIAVLGPPSPELSARDRLIAEGKLIPARAPFALPRQRRLPKGSPLLSEILAEMRQERLP